MNQQATSLQQGNNVICQVIGLAVIYQDIELSYIQGCLLSGYMVGCLLSEYRVDICQGIGLSSVRV